MNKHRKKPTKPPGYNERRFWMWFGRLVSPLKNFTIGWENYALKRQYLSTVRRGDPLTYKNEIIGEVTSIEHSNEGLIITGKINNGWMTGISGGYLSGMSFVEDPLNPVFVEPDLNVDRKSMRSRIEKELYGDVLAEDLPSFDIDYKTDQFVPDEIRVFDQNPPLEVDVDREQFIPLKHGDKVLCRSAFGYPSRVWTVNFHDGVGFDEEDTPFVEQLQSDQFRKDVEGTAEELQAYLDKSVKMKDDGD